MKLPIIQSLWIGDALSNLEKLCIRSFLDHGHEFHLYVYDEVGGVPSGAVVKDANKILLRDKIFRYRGGSLAGFSNWFRYELLNRCGGFWADMDTVCIRPFDFADELYIQLCDDCLFTTSPLRAPPGHPLLREMIRRCESHRRREGSKFGSVGGPRPLTRGILKLNLQPQATSASHMGAGAWNNYCDDTFRGGVADLSPRVYFLHFGNASAGKRIFDKNAKYDDDSLFEILKTRHGIATAADAKRITAAQIHTDMRDHRLFKFERRAAAKKKAASIAAIVLIALGGLVYLMTA